MNSSLKASPSDHQKHLGCADCSDCPDLALARPRLQQLHLHGEVLGLGGGGHLHQVAPVVLAPLVRLPPALDCTKTTFAPAQHQVISWPRNMRQPSPARPPSSQPASHSPRTADKRRSIWSHVALDKCLRSRPRDPDVIRVTVSSNVETKMLMTG